MAGSTGNGWEEVDYYPDGREQKALKKEFKFKDFMSALEFVNKVGELAEKANHHPDIEISWGLAVIVLTTHDESAITKKDYSMAKAIDEL